MGSDQPAVPRPVLERLGSSAAQLSSLRPANALLRRTLWTAIVALVLASVAAAGATAWSRLPDFDWRFNAWWLSAAVAGFAALHLSHAELWYRLLGSLRQSVDRRRARSIWCTSGLARYTPGSLLMPMVRVAMSEREGVPKRICLASVVYEIALLLAGATVVGAYALVSAPELSDQPLRFALLALPVIAVSGLHPRVFRPLADVALRRLGRERLPFALGMTRVLLLAVAYSATWVLAGFSLYSLTQGVHPITPEDFLIVLAAPAVGYVAALLAFMLPGGLGARETGLAAVLTAAVPIGVAVAVAVAVRLVQLVVELVCAAITPVLARRHS